MKLPIYIIAHQIDQSATGREIRRMRRAKEMTQEELGEAIGCLKMKMCRLEKGVGVWTHELVGKAVTAINKAKTKV